MFNYASMQDFDVLKQRWMKELADGCQNIDKRLVKTLKRFNTLPGVVSVWCCSGHTRAEHEARNTTLPYEDRQKRNIIFVVAPAAASVFKAFAQYIATMQHNDWALVRPELKTSDLIWCFDDEPTLRRYPIWTLQVSYSNLTETNREPNEMSKAIHEAMEAIWEEMIEYLIDYCEKEPVCL